MLKTTVEKKEKWMYTPKEGEQFFFMHIPKTGGTTFRRMLTNHFPEGSYYPTHEDLIANGGKYFSQKKLVEQKGILRKPLIMGHYSIDLIKKLNPNVKVMTFFRNPLDRILSHVKHIIAHDPELKGADPNDVVKRRIGAIYLVQSKMMGFEPKKKNFDVVKTNMEMLDFVGILEFFDESVERFNQYFGWNLESVEKDNISAMNLYSFLSLKSKALIASKMGKELHTYNSALRVFEKGSLN